MNKRLEKEFGEHISEKRDWHWSLTSFAISAWEKQKKRKIEIFIEVTRIYLKVH